MFAWTEPSAGGPAVLPLLGMGKGGGGGDTAVRTLCRIKDAEAHGAPQTAHGGGDLDAAPSDACGAPLMRNTW